MNSSFSRSSSRSRSFWAASSCLADSPRARRCSLEQELALVRVLAQAPVARLELPGDAVEDREERDVEREQRQRQDQREPAARVTDADRDRAVVLVELDRADRLRPALQPHRHDDAQDLQVLLAAPGLRVRHAPLDRAGEHLPQLGGCWHRRPDQDVVGRVGDRAVRADEPAADDARDEDALAEEPVERARRARRHRAQRSRTAGGARSDSRRRPRGAWLSTVRCARLATSLLTSQAIASPAASSTAPAYSAKRSTSLGRCSVDPSVRVGKVASCSPPHESAASGLAAQGFLPLNRANCGVNPPSGGASSLDSGLRTPRGRRERAQSGRWRRPRTSASSAGTTSGSASSTRPRPNGRASSSARSPGSRTSRSTRLSASSSTTTATSATRAPIRSPAASTRRCTAAGSGRCASSPASAPPRRRTSASATCSSTARPASRPPSTCRR